MGIREGEKTVEEKDEVSSGEEELEEAYANIEVNFDESETEEEEESLASVANNGGKRRQRGENTLVRQLSTSKTQMLKTTLQRRIMVKDLRFKLLRKVI